MLNKLFDVRPLPRSTLLLYVSEAHPVQHLVGQGAIWGQCLHGHGPIRSGYYLRYVTLPPLNLGPMVPVGGHYYGLLQKPQHVASTIVPEAMRWMLIGEYMQ